MKHPSLLSELAVLPERGFQSDIVTSANGHRTNGHSRHSFVRRFARGSLLFLEGDTCGGVYILKSGRVKLSVDQSHDRTVIVGVANPPDIIGLAAAVSGTPYGATAEALESCETEFIPREQFLRLLTTDRDIAWHALQQLSDSYVHMCEVVASLSGSDPVIVRLARLFASWAPQRSGHRSLLLKNKFTHQQMAEMIGTTRETVTRSLSEMRVRGLATVRGGELIIHDHERLLLLAANGANHAAEIL